MIQLLKRNSFFSKNLLYIYHKLKNRHLVKFWYSTYISHKCVFEGMNMVGKKAFFYGTLGYGSSVGDGSFISAEVGKFTSIGSRCIYTNTFHPYKEPFVTTCPLFYSLFRGKTPHGTIFAQKQVMEEFKFYDKKREIVNKIGSDCWIGLDVNLIGGIEIGDGAVVLSRAVVTKDIPPYAIVGGIPAKIIGYRYDKRTIDFLIHVKWWNNTPEWFKQNWYLLNDIDTFKQYYIKRI